jgi:itaconyl-CoA hydratase
MSVERKQVAPNRYRESNQGVVTVRTSGRKADGTVFMTYERSFLVSTRRHAIDDIADY